ncbi:hypothetical protein Patl1_04452 [Pistacia atlantica]|uniref:Uncharacterized protein n=1 Tax=Pistacia atlantica TaxID=434234 RepID=A0ACC1BW76_9ROSI|nr:hypothetical protein Patl1_04452 [Pistacia atlantica]
MKNDHKFSSPRSKCATGYINYSNARNFYKKPKLRELIDVTLRVSLVLKEVCSLL